MGDEIAQAGLIAHHFGLCRRIPRSEVAFDTGGLEIPIDNDDIERPAVEQRRQVGERHAPAHAALVGVERVHRHGAPPWNTIRGTVARPLRTTSS